MRKCTLCVDRIYRRAAAAVASGSRPACWPARAHARHFGDFDDAGLAGVAGGRARGRRLMPELDYKPVNRYLPPRAAPKVDTAQADARPANLKDRLRAIANRLIEL
jgi:Fe-S-cluster-containing dehydrogenase component